MFLVIFVEIVELNFVIYVLGRVVDKKVWDRESKFVILFIFIMCSSAIVLFSASDSKYSFIEPWYLR